jgi:hypothetical protein
VPVLALESIRSKPLVPPSQGAYPVLGAVRAFARWRMSGTHVKKRAPVRLALRGVHRPRIIRLEIGEGLLHRVQVARQPRPPLLRSGSALHQSPTASLNLLDCRLPRRFRSEEASSIGHCR